MTDRGNDLHFGLFPLFPCSRLSLLLFAEVCLLAAVAGILCWRCPGPGLTLFALIVWLDRPRSTRWANAVCLAAVFILAWCYTGLREPSPPPVPQWLAETAYTGRADPRPGPACVSATVREATPLPGNRLRVLLDNLTPTGSSGPPYGGRVVWTWYNPLPLIPGDTITADLRLAAQHGMRNPGVWDTDRHWHDRKVWFRAYAPSSAHIVAQGPPATAMTPAYAAAALRQRLCERFRANLPAARDGMPEPGSPASLLLALVFGDRTLLTPELTDRFARSTLAHSLALSGMHLGFAVLAGFVSASLLGRLWPGLWLRLTRPLAALLFSLPFTCLYLWLGGAPVSLVRTACMLLFWTVLLLCKRPRVLPDGLFAAVALLLILNPLALFDVSLQLSALSVAAISLTIRPITDAASRLFAPNADDGPKRVRKHALLRRVTRAAFVLTALSLIIQIALLPLVTRVFGTSGLLFPLNLIWLPVLGAIVLPLAFAGLGLTAAGLDGPAALTLHAAGWPCEGFLALLARLDEVGWLVSPLLPRPHWLTIAGYWLLCLALPGLLRRPLSAARARCRGVPVTPPGRVADNASWLAPCLLGLAMLLAPPLWRVAESGRERVSVTMFDVGQGQAVLVEWGGDRAGRVLVDGGGSASPFFDIGGAIIAPVLTDNALPRLNAIVASHPDTDHLGGLLFLLERFTVGSYYGNGVEALPSLAARERAALAASGLSRQTLQAGERLTLAPDLVLETLWPTADARDAVRGAGPGREKSNDVSLVQRLVWKGKPLLLLCGDAERTALEVLLDRRANLAAPVLALPHHGSADSLTPGFYEAVNPKLALASCGFGNRWGFPAPQVRQALDSLGIPLLTTAREGWIRVQWDAPDAFRVITAWE